MTIFQVRSFVQIYVTRKHFLRENSALKNRRNSGRQKNADLNPA